MKLRTITKSLDDFFFLPQPVHSVALLRIAFGFILLLNWLSIWKNLDLFWGVNGILSLDTAVKYSGAMRFNLFEFLPNDPRVPALMAVLHLIGVIGMTLGFFTRASLFLTFFTLLSFHNRNIFILNSSDMVVRNFLFLLFFSPSGEAFSLDRWMATARGLVQGAPKERSPWALRLMQIQFSIIYLATVMFKMKGPSWADGTAVYIATRLDEFVRVPLDLLNSLMVIKFLTWSTLVIEFSLGTLVWIRELRYWVLLAGVALHLGIEYTMSIPLFEWIMIVAMICMVDSRDIEVLINKVKIFRQERLKEATV
ncbi:HTTM domain-containing protein [Bdellovibrio sp. BCCA]|uniref:HTTM domain-containing protein n=1 Tax=Bdellovibrio sp. BCCA TaxID=3136281 RepID=UPI0030F230B1